MSWKRVLGGVLFGALALLALVAWWYLPSLRAEVRLAPMADDSVERFVVGGEDVYRQNDPAWASDKIGGSTSENGVRGGALSEMSGGASCVETTVSVVAKPKAAAAPKRSVRRSLKGFNGDST